MGRRDPVILVYSRSRAEAYAEFIRQQNAGVVHTASSPDLAKALVDHEQVEIILSDGFPSNLLSGATSVKWIQSIGAGVNDLLENLTTSEHVKISRIVGQFGGPIAEYVFAFLLFIQKDVLRMLSAQEHQVWDRFAPSSLAGKTIGVAGLGSIGTEVVRKARAFDMYIKGLSMTGNNAGIVDEHFDSDNWTQFVQDLDFLVLTLPLTPQTHYCVSREVLRHLKTGAWVVNVGRGQLINESDLIDALQGHLSGAVLDVFESEPLSTDSPLWSMPNVIVTPHLSGVSDEEKVGRYFVDNLKRYQAGEPLVGLVNRVQGY